MYGLKLHSGAVVYVLLIVFVFDCTSTKLFKFCFQLLLEVLFIYIAFCHVIFSVYESAYMHMYNLISELMDIKIYEYHALKNNIHMYYMISSYVLVLFGKLKNL